MRLHVALICLMIAALVFPALSFSDELSHRQAAETLLDLSDTEAALDNSIELMLQLQLQQDANLQLYLDVMRDFFQKYMSWASLKEQFIDIYVAEFTEEELRGMADFFRTPIGQKALKKSPALMEQGALIGQQRVMENLDELEEMIAQETARLEALRVAEPDTPQLISE